MSCMICISKISELGYKCKCLNLICAECISEYIKHTSTIVLRCSCGELIKSSKVNCDEESISMYSTRILKQIELNNFSEITSIMEHNGTIAQIRRKRELDLNTFPACIQYCISTCYKKELQSVTKQRDKVIKQKIFKDMCANVWCTGNIINESCNKCNTIHCAECKEIKKEDHECNSDTLASLSLIDTTLHKCPNCQLPIEKSSGCSYLTCAACKTKFNHTTNEISSSGGHSTLIEVTEKYSLAEKLNVSKKDKDKIRELENKKEPSPTTCIKYFVANEIERAVEAYEKYIIQQDKYKHTMEILKALGNNPDEKMLEKILKSL